MSAKISYSLTIENLDPTIAKLKVLNDLLNKVDRKGGLNQLGNNLNLPGGGKGNNVIIPPTPSVAERIAPPLAAALPALAAAKAAKDAWTKTGDVLAAAAKNAGMHLYPQQPNSALPNIFPPIKNTSILSTPSTPSRYSGPVPPVIPPPMLSWFTRFKDNFKSGGFGELTKGKGLKELFSAAGAGGEISKLVSMFGRLGLVGAIVIGALMAFKFALKLAIEGIKIAAEAYQQAARRGINVSSSQRLNSVFAALGMQSPDLSRLSPQLGRGNDTNAILTAARAGQLGDEGQQLVNMAEDFKRLMKDVENSSRQIQESSRAGFELSMQAKEIGIEWKALLSQIAALSYNYMSQFLQGIKFMLQYINDLFETLNLFAQLIGLTPKGDDQNFKKNVFNGGNNQSNNTSLEKMGLLFGGASGYGSLDKNTATIASNSSIMVKLLSKLAIHAPELGSSVPFLP